MCRPSANIYAPFEQSQSIFTLVFSCYVNAIIQALHGVSSFQRFFISLPDCISNQVVSSGIFSSPQSLHCVQSSGAKTPPPATPPPLIRTNTPSIFEDVQTKAKFDLDTEVSLAAEIHNLFRIIESGRWACVTPYKLILAIWRHVPNFRSYKQQVFFSRN